MGEYSYFLAKGRSLAAVEEVISARAEIERIKRHLAEFYDAEDFGFWPGRNGEKDIITFIYRSTEKVPDCMTVDQEQKRPDGTVECVFASIKPGTADAFNITNMLGLISRALKRVHLEDVFECGDMPMKELPAGKYSMAFVRAKTVVGKWGDYTYRPKDNDEGTIPSTMAACGGSNGAMKQSDPLDWAKLDGDWYIRVPNDKAGKPLFMPPDAAPVAFAYMLKLDEQEWAIRRGYQPPPLKKSSGPSGP